MLRTRGLGQDSGAGLSNDDYEKEYGEPDKQFLETGPNARVYRMFLKEAAAFDRNLVDENKDSVDVILVFAGLFSAVVTTFLAQVSLNLQQDQTAVSSSLLYELVQVQRAVAKGESVDNVAASPLNPNTPYSPDTIAVWVNGLWVSSLVASLCVALFAVLVKQWLYRYDSFSSGDTRYRSHRRQYRYLGFDRWGVTTIIGLLPIIMHSSLGLFLIGLVLFYIPLRLSLAIAVAGITAIAFLFYFISNVLPVFNPQCPYQTPLTQFLCFSIASIFRSLLFFKRCFRIFFNKILIFLPLLKHIFYALTTSVFHIVWSRRNAPILPDLANPPSRLSSWQSFLQTMNDRERTQILERSHELAVETLYWLFTTSPNPTIHSIVAQALGGLDPNSVPRVEDIFKLETLDNLYAVQKEVFRQSTRYIPGGDVRRVIRPGCEGDVERILRSFTVLPSRYDYYAHNWLVDVSTLSPAIAASVCTSPLVGGTDTALFLAHEALLSMAIQRHNVALYPSQWNAALREILSRKRWSMDQRPQISAFFVLILPVMLSPSNPSHSQATGRVNMITCAQMMANDDTFWKSVQKIVDVFSSPVSAVNPAPQPSDMKARTATKMMVLALDNLGLESGTNAVNRTIYLKLLAGSLKLVNHLLGRQQQLAYDFYASFPSLCVVFVTHTKLLETKNDGRRLLNEIRTCFLSFCTKLLFTPSPPNDALLFPPELIDMVSSFAHLSVTDSNHPLRGMEEKEYEGVVLQALGIMIIALRSGCLDALMIFVRDDWIHFLCGWMWLENKWRDSALRLVDAFIQGLNHSRTSSHKEYFSSYLFEGNNLLCSLLMLSISCWDDSQERRNVLRLARVAVLRPAQVEWEDEWDGSNSNSACLIQLAAFNPNNLKWKDVRSTLKEILHWQRNPHHVDFPLKLKESLRIFRERAPPRYFREHPFSLTSDLEELFLDEYLQRELIRDRPRHIHDIGWAINVLEHYFMNNL